MEHLLSLKDTVYSPMRIIVWWVNIHSKKKRTYKPEFLCEL